MKGELDIDGVDAVCAGRSTDEEVEKATDLVHEYAHDDTDRAELLDALGLTNTHTFKGDR